MPKERWAPKTDSPSPSLRAKDIERASPTLHDLPRSPGETLDASTRAFMECRFGHDFSKVRVHADARAAESARAVRAAAYTAGSDIVFGAGQFAPSTEPGRRLLAHELVHTLQQRGAAPSASGELNVNDPLDQSELEADHVADAAMRGRDHRGPVEVHTATHPGMQRQPLPGGSPGPRIPDSDSLIENASPILASAIGSATLDAYETGSAKLSATHTRELEKTAHNIVVLLRRYSRSTIKVTGFADTVGPEARNMELGSERAEAVKRALMDLNVPGSIIGTVSQGEGPPQAVKTKDETPNARNRRTVVRFSPEASTLGPLVPGLARPGETQPSPPAERPRIDLQYHPKIEVPDPKHPKVPEEVWKPLPPPVAGTGPRSALDLINERLVDPIVDTVTKGLGLSKSLRDKVRDAAHDAVRTGVAKGARAAAERAGVKDPKALDAIEKAAEAAIQEKGNRKP